MRAWALRGTVAARHPSAWARPACLPQAGITDGIPTDPTIVRPLNGQVITGFAQLGDQTSNPQFQNPFIIDPKINYTLLRGRHTLKFGYEYQSVATAVSDFNPTFGQDTYAGQFSRPTGVAVNNVYNLADFVFGLRSNYQLNNTRVVGLEQKYTTSFMWQDDFKVLAPPSH